MSHDIALYDLHYNLHDFADYELAFMVKFRSDTLTDSAKEQLAAEIASRNLQQDYLDGLLAEKLANEVRDHNCKICPRCTSKRIQIIQEEFHGNNKAFGLDSDKPLTCIEYKICSACGWNFSVDETQYEKKERVTKALVSLLASILVALLLTYLIIKFGAIPFK